MSSSPLAACPVYKLKSPTSLFLARSLLCHMLSCPPDVFTEMVSGMAHSVSLTVSVPSGAVQPSVSQLTEDFLYICLRLQTSRILDSTFPSQSLTLLLLQSPSKILCSASSIFQTFARPLCFSAFGHYPHSACHCFPRHEFQDLFMPLCSPFIQSPNSSYSYFLKNMNLVMLL